MINLIIINCMEQRLSYMKGLVKFLGTQSRLFCVIVIVALIGFSMAGCDFLPLAVVNDPDPKGDDFVPVTGISGINASTAVGNYTLNGTVTPSSATNKTIAWSVFDAGGTEAAISGNVLNTKKTGTVIVKATIANGTAPGTNYTNTFTISVISIIPVTSITEVPETLAVGTHILSPEVVPSSASNKEIVWTVSDSDNPTNVKISGNLIDTLKAGALKLKATIKNGKASGINYTQDFTITITNTATTFREVNDITILTNKGTVGELLLTGMVAPEDATHRLIIWSVEDAGTTGAVISGSDGDILKTTKAGTVTVRATVRNGKSALAEPEDYTKDFEIKIGAVAFVAVTDITGVPGIMVKESNNRRNNLLNPTVAPDNATYTKINWSTASEGAAIDTDSKDKKYLNATKIGTIKLTATIADGKAAGTPFTKDFNISIVFPAPKITIKRETGNFRFSVTNHDKDIDHYVLYKKDNDTTGHIVQSALTLDDLAAYQTYLGINSTELKYIKIRAFTATDKGSPITYFPAMLKYDTSSKSRDQLTAEDWLTFLKWAKNKFTNVPFPEGLSEIPVGQEEEYCEENKSGLVAATNAVLAGINWTKMNIAGSLLISGTIPENGVNSVGGGEGGPGIDIDSDDARKSLQRLWFNNSLPDTTLDEKMQDALTEEDYVTVVYD